MIMALRWMSPLEALVDNPGEGRSRRIKAARNGAPVWFDCKRSTKIHSKHSLAEKQWLETSLPGL